MPQMTPPKTTLLRKAVGGLFIVVSLMVAYWWFYKLAPLRHLADPSWRAAHSEEARWLEEQENYRRMGASPDLCFRGDRIGYYGDKQWFLWLVEKTASDENFRVCGCTTYALSLMSNHEVELWEEWAKANEGQTQEQWIREGFDRYGLTVHLPPDPDDTEPLLRVLGQKTWSTLWNGPQGTDAPEAVPSYIQYNAFRWLRDSGFDPMAFAASHAAALDSESVRVGLLQYTEWQTAYPRDNKLGILALGTTPDTEPEVFGLPLIVRPWFVAVAHLSVIVPLAAGCLLLIPLRRRRGRQESTVEPSRAPEPAAGPVSKGESSPPAR